MPAQEAPVRLYADFPYNRPNHWLVSAIAVYPAKKGNVIALNLVHDPAEPLRVTDGTFKKWALSKPKPLSDPPPIAVVRLEACLMASRRSGCVPYSTPSFCLPTLQKVLPGHGDVIALQVRWLFVQLRSDWIGHDSSLNPRSELHVFRNVARPAIQICLAIFHLGPVVTISDGAGIGALLLFGRMLLDGQGVEPRDIERPTRPSCR